MVLFVAPAAAIQDLDPAYSSLVLDYLELYNQRSETSSFNVEVTRGMAKGNDPDELYVLNSYASSLLRFDLGDLQDETLKGGHAPNQVWSTLMDPVAVATLDGDVYVLGQGTHALARHDGATGRILDVFAPRNFSEPADLVIDEQRREAYVSCMGSDCVVRIDLGSAGSGGHMAEIERWTSTKVGPTDFVLKRPRFLHWDGRDLYVAPFLAGNNSMTIGTETLSNQGGAHQWDPSVISGSDIYDAYAADSPIALGLPDVDLFRIRPGQPGQAAWEPIFRDAGSLLTAHGKDPATGKYWMLGIDGMNVQVDAAGVQLDTEPKLKGRFARNTMVVSPLPAAGAPPLTVTDAVIDLDQPTAQQQYSTAGALPFPHALAMGGPNDMVAVASSTLSRVRLFDGDGNVQASIPPSGAQHKGLVVRDLMFRGDDLLIYCQETSEILVWPVIGGAPAAQHSLSLDLLSDPTTPAIARGRRLFYDSKRSLNWRSTCATCHPGGESDLLAWPLKDGVHDFKDQTVTQPLKGLRETYPYHWRGERDLLAFNGAFKSLLGAADTLDVAGVGQTPDEWENFEDFLFSLRPAANPLERLDRKPPKSSLVPGVPTTGDPLVDALGDVGRGQALYHLQTSSCNQCHMVPTGSIGSHMDDNTMTAERFMAWNQNMETIQLSNFLQQRDQRLVSIEVPDPSGGGGLVQIDRPQLGFGIQHTGAFTSHYHFVRSRWANLLTTHLSNPSEADLVEAARDVSAYIRVLDTGTPPAAHLAIVLDQDREVTSSRGIQRLLIEQAERGWIDVVVRGTVPDPNQPGSLIDAAWLYDPQSSRFRSDRPAGSSPGPQGLAYFRQFATHPDMRNLFMGVPAGLGQRLGVDFDRDGIVNGEERGLQGWIWDRDGDSLPDGYERDNGGTEDDPSQQPQDSTPPSLTIDPATGELAFQPVMVRATHAEFNFVASEEVRWELEVRSALPPVFGIPTVHAIGPSFAVQHTAQIHDLRASTESGTQSTYHARLTLVDRGLLTTVIDIPDVFATLVDLGKPVNADITRERMAVTELTKLSEAYDGSLFTYEATLLVGIGDFERLDRPGLPNRIVILQALARDVEDEPWEIVVPNRLSHSGLNPNNKALPSLWEGEAYPITPGGPFMVLAPTDAEGQAQISLQVTGVNAGRQLAVNVLAVLDAADNQGPTLGDPSYPQTAFAKWIMPATDPGLRLLRLR